MLDDVLDDQDEMMEAATKVQVNRVEHQNVKEVAGVSGSQLKSCIERIERLEEEKAAISTDIKEIYAEAKGTGFEPKIIRQIIRLRKMEKDTRDELEHLLETYKTAIGMA